MLLSILLWQKQYGSKLLVSPNVTTCCTRTVSPLLLLDGNTCVIFRPLGYIMGNTLDQGSASLKQSSREDEKAGVNQRWVTSATRVPTASSTKYGERKASRTTSEITAAAASSKAPAMARQQVIKAQAPGRLPVSLAKTTSPTWSPTTTTKGRHLAA